MARRTVRRCTPRCSIVSRCVHHTRFPSPFKWACTSFSTAASSVGFISDTTPSTLSSLSLDMVSPPCRRTSLERQQMGNRPLTVKQVALDIRSWRRTTQGSHPREELPAISGRLFGTSSISIPSFQCAARHHAGRSLVLPHPPNRQTGRWVHHLLLRNCR